MGSAASNNWPGGWNLGLPPWPPCASSSVSETSSELSSRASLEKQSWNTENCDRESLPLLITKPLLKNCRLCVSLTLQLYRKADI